MCAHAATLSFKPFWQEVDWLNTLSIFRLHVAKLKCGDGMSMCRIVPGCSNTAGPFRQRLSSTREGESCLFFLGTTGRLVEVVYDEIGLWLGYHKALISRGKGDISCPLFFIEVVRFRAPMLCCYGEGLWHSAEGPFKLCCLWFYHPYFAMSEVSHWNRLVRKCSRLSVSCWVLLILFYFLIDHVAFYRSHLLRSVALARLKHSMRGLLLHMVLVVRNSFTSMRIPHTSSPPLELHCEAVIWMRDLCENKLVR